MPRVLRHGAAVATLLALTACVHSPAPQYQSGVANLQVLRAGTTKIAVDDIATAERVEDGRLVMRGNSMTGAGSDGTFSTYLQQALESELRTAGRFDPAAGLRLSGTLTANRLHADGASTGRATVAARFVVTRDGKVVYDAVQTAGHEWESSFMGAIAIPAAMQGYVATVQKLVGQLFADPAFVEATR
jgi:hypothetical protein